MMRLLLALLLVACGASRTAALDAGSLETCDRARLCALMGCECCCLRTSEVYLRGDMLIHARDGGDLPERWTIPCHACRGEIDAPDAGGECLKPIQ